MFRRAAALGISALGIAVGLFTLRVAQDNPGYWFAGTSQAANAALLLAGWSLIACGLVSWLQRPDSRFGPLLVAAGFAWFLPEWNNPGANWALVFTAGIGLYAICPSLVGHAVLAYPRGRVRTRAEETAVACSYVGSFVVLGLAPALLLDPAAQGCSQCPPNLLAVADRATFASDLTRAGIYLGVVWALALTALSTLRLRRAATRPVVVAGTAYLVLVTATFAVSLDRGSLSNGTLERRLWLGEAAALVGMTAAVAWNWVRARRARSQMARLVVELSYSPPPGGLRDVLAQIVGDAELVLAYPLDDTGRLVDANGRAVEVARGLQRTTLVSGGRTVAVLAHAPGLLDDEQLVDEVTAAARLALENERLQAEVCAHLEELRASRARIVAAGDAERRRLERDLHDGAQQRLVGLALSLRLLRSHLAARELETADAELAHAIEDLRELAHGIFPAVLSDEGFAAAVEALTEDARVPIRLGSLPEGRFASPVENAAYTIVAEAAGTASRGLAVRAGHRNGLLTVDLETQDIDGLDVAALEDRIGALDGRLTVGPGRDGRVTIHAELPCES
jgi:signal transduction histidine kinase